MAFLSGISVSRSTMWGAIARLGPTRRKGTGSHRAGRVLKGGLASEGGRGGATRERLIFVDDECGTHTSSAPIYGHAPRGERLHPRVPRGRGKNATLLSGMSTQGMGPSLGVEGATTARVFET